MKNRKLARQAVLAALLVSGTAILAFGQANDKPQPDRWRGLVLGESTVNDARKVLGAAKVRVIAPTETDGPNAILQEWTPAESFESVRLRFVDGKLDMIVLEKPAKPIAASEIPKIYATNFDVRIGEKVQLLQSSNDDLHKEKVSPKAYPAVYYLVAITERSLVQCRITKGSVADAGAAAPKSAADAPFPGTVDEITLTRRKVAEKVAPEVKQ